MRKLRATMMNVPSKYVRMGVRSFVLTNSSLKARVTLEDLGFWNLDFGMGKAEDPSEIRFALGFHRASTPVE
jgi:hypothetical protein